MDSHFQNDICNSRCFLYFCYVADAAIKTTIDFLVNANNFAHNNLEILEPLLNAALINFALLTSQGIKKGYVYINIYEYKYEYMIICLFYMAQTHTTHLFRSKSFPKNVNKPEIGGDSSFPE